jgi:hypothetical protein
VLDDLGLETLLLLEADEEREVTLYGFIEVLVPEGEIVLPLYITLLSPG